MKLVEYLESAFSFNIFNTLSEKEDLKKPLNYCLNNSTKQNSLATLSKSRPK